MMPAIGHSRRTQSAFTLIELLVVIAIIAILANMIFPVFATAREKGRQTACLSNMQQLGLAFQQYAQDSDEQYPCSGPPLPLDGGTVCSGVGWAGDILPYVKEPNVYHCPDDASTFPNSNLKQATFTMPPGFVQLSYLYNDNLTNSLNSYRPFSVGAAGYISKLNAPSMTVLLFEAGQMCFNPSSTDGIDGPLADGTGNGIVGSGTSDGVFCPELYVRSPGSNQCVAGTGAEPCTGALFPSGPSFGQRFSTGLYGNVSYYIHYTQDARHSGGEDLLACDGHAKWVAPDFVSTGVNSTGESDFIQGDPRCAFFFGQANYCAAGTDSMVMPSGAKAIMTMSTF
jgi:prepilin-type N-terminal cleavage/methylation domain-containing protein